MLTKLKITCYIKSGKKLEEFSRPKVNDCMECRTCKKGKAKDPWMKHEQNIQARADPDRKDAHPSVQYG